MVNPASPPRSKKRGGFALVGHIRKFLKGAAMPLPQTKDECTFGELLENIGFSETATEPFFAARYAPHIIAPLTCYVFDGHIHGVGKDDKKRSRLLAQIEAQLCDPNDAVIGVTARAFSPLLNPQIKIYLVAFGQDQTDRLIFIHSNTQDQCFAPALLSDLVRMTADAPPTTSSDILNAIGHCPPISLEHVSAQLVHGVVSAPAPR